MEKEMKNLKKRCRRCDAPLVAGRAFQNELVGHPDFPGDTGWEAGRTRSYSGEARLINVMKCPACGYSITDSTKAK
jgi:hypothetical protein